MEKGSSTAQNPQSKGAGEVIRRNYKGFLPYIVIVFVGLIALLFYAKSSSILDQRDRLSNEEVRAGLDGKNEQVSYYEMKEIIVQINSDNQDKFLRITLSLQVDKKATLTKIAEILPQIEDSIHSYLRQLKTSDLNSSFGLYKMRNDLLLRINTMIYPSKVDAVFIKDVFVK